MRCSVCKSIVAFAVALVTTTLVACGSTLSGTALPAEIDIRKLDIGPYPTDPLNAHDEDFRPSFYNMKDVAAMRLADYMASAYDIDPVMKYGRRPSEISSGFMPAELGTDSILEPIAKKNKLLYGFKSNGSDRDSSVFPYGWPTKTANNSTTVSIMVMQFPDADRAKTAAAEFYDADLASYGDQNKAVPLPKYTEARSHWRPGSPFLRSMLARGPYVVAFLVSANIPDLNALTPLVEKAYGTQLPLLDQLKPLSDEEVLQLPWDQDHLLSRALNPDETPSPRADGYYAVVGLRGVLHFAGAIFNSDRDFAKQRFEAMNADRFGLSYGTIVAHTSGIEPARKVVAERITLSRAANNVDSPPNVPDSACVENKEDDYVKRFTCIVAYREYVAFVNSDQLLDVHQRAAAQYAIFANSR